MIRVLMLLAALTAGMVQVGNAAKAKSLTQYGITWTFDKEYETGNFVNGDWWVVGPVTITAISPKWSNSRNGTMINPSRNATQGLINTGKAGDGYISSQNIATQLPKLVPVNSSVLSTKGDPKYPTDADQAFDNAAVLTVLDKVPPAGSFRPPYFGSEKPLYNESQLNFDVFLDLEPTPSCHSPAELYAKESCKYVFIDLHGIGGAAKSSEAKLGSPTPAYGRSVGSVHGHAALALNLNYTDEEKKPLLIQLVQRGIDVYGGVITGYAWHADGGHRAGRKLPMYIAGKALGAEEILKYVDTDTYTISLHAPGDRIADRSPFQEDQQHFYVDQHCIDESDYYGPGHLGMPDWKAQAWTKVDHHDISGWTNGYRNMNGKTVAMIVLATTFMGDRALWNHEAMYEYMINRFWPERGHVNIGSTNGVTRMTFELWNKYFGKVDPPAGGAVRFTAGTTTGNKGLSVSFTNHTPDGYGNWQWDFGDGSTSTEKEPTHVYNEYGKYTVTLKADGPTGTETIIRRDYITIINPLMKTVLVEAENMMLSGYVREDRSAMTLVMLDVNGSGTGTATTQFTGAGGKYTVSVFYVPENDGAPTIKLAVAGQQVLSETYPMDAAFYQLGTVREAKVTDVQINLGDEIKLTGIADQQAWARVDKIIFKPESMDAGIHVHNTSTGAGQDSPVRVVTEGAAYRFLLPYTVRVSGVIIFDQKGRTVRTLYPAKGEDRLVWDGTGREGAVPAGVYFYRAVGIPGGRPGRLVKIK